MLRILTRERDIQQNHPGFQRQTQSVPRKNSIDPDPNQTPRALPRRHRRRRHRERHRPLREFPSSDASRRVLTDGDRVLTDVLTVARVPVRRARPRSPLREVDDESSTPRGTASRHPARRRARRRRPADRHHRHRRRLGRRPRARVPRAASRAIDVIVMGRGARGGGRRES